MSTLLFEVSDTTSISSFSSPPLSPPVDSSDPLEETGFGIASMDEIDQFFDVSLYTKNEDKEEEQQIYHQQFHHQYQQQQQEISNDEESLDGEEEENDGNITNEIKTNNVENLNVQVQVTQQHIENESIVSVANRRTMRNTNMKVIKDTTIITTTPTIVKPPPKKRGRKPLNPNSPKKLLQNTKALNIRILVDEALRTLGGKRNSDQVLEYMETHLLDKISKTKSVKWKTRVMKVLNQNFLKEKSKGISYYSSNRVESNQQPQSPEPTTSAIGVDVPFGTPEVQPLEKLEIITPFFKMLPDENILEENFEDNNGSSDSDSESDMELTWNSMETYREYDESKNDPKEEDENVEIDEDEEEEQDHEQDEEEDVEIEEEEDEEDEDEDDDDDDEEVEIKQKSKNLGNKRKRQSLRLKKQTGSQDDSENEGNAATAPVEDEKLPEPEPKKRKKRVAKKRPVGHMSLTDMVQSALRDHLNGKGTSHDIMNCLKEHFQPDVLSSVWRSSIAGMLSARQPRFKNKDGTYIYIPITDKNPPRRKFKLKNKKHKK